ncbi:MAG: hypothetical protein A2X49_15630 [Lentisphaerae bacterium GWF2_52_8]|nr:MAG: hypothetical protein A2X49_15630 [Lentisphaerae bacterium GWF2_52_8]
MKIFIPVFVKASVSLSSAIDLQRLLIKLGYECGVCRIDDPRDCLKHLRKEVADCKPDMIVAINQLRRDFNDIFPKEIPFVTWVQDNCDNIHRIELAEIWRKNPLDYIFGYVDELLKYAYPPERLCYLTTIVSPEKFRPRELSASDLEKYACDICFASEKSEDIYTYIRYHVMFAYQRFGLKEEDLFELADALYAHYQQGGKLRGFAQFDQFMKGMPKLAPAYFGANHDGFLILFYWHIAERIFRHVTLDMILATGAKLHLYGGGWEANAKYRKYAKGILPHGPELSKAYQAAKFSLHVNSFETFHHRPLEILMGGGRPLARCSMTGGTPRIFDPASYAALQQESVAEIFDRISKRGDGRGIKGEIIIPSLGDINAYMNCFDNSSQLSAILDK